MAEAGFGLQQRTKEEEEASAEFPDFPTIALQFILTRE
jgi:hypothetical protein